MGFYVTGNVKAHLRGFLYKSGHGEVALWRGLITGGRTIWATRKTMAGRTGREAKNGTPVCLRYEVADPDYDDEEEEYEEGVKEEVEHRTDEGADDAGQDGFHEKFGLRSRQRQRRGWGQLVLPDTRGLAAPVFVKRPVPGAKAQGGQKEEREPEH